MSGKRYLDLAEIFGARLAMFYCCVIYNCPYIPSIIKSRQWADWSDYCDYLKEIGADVCDGEQVGFLDGMTDIREIINDSSDEHKRWIDTWGVGDETKPYSDQDYRHLDRLFKTYSARLVSSGGYDAQQEDVLRYCCKCRLQADKRIARGSSEDIAAASKLNDIVQKLLSSENLRRKDERPIEEVRIDSIVDSLEKAGLLKEGKILPLDDVLKVLLTRLGRLGGKVSKRYPYTLDAADQMILAIINNIRENNGFGTISTLPEEARLDSTVKNEFADAPNSTEKFLYRKFGYVRNDGEESDSAEPTEG